MARRSQKHRRANDNLGQTIVDRTTELTSWVDYCYQVMKRGVMIYAYAIAVLDSPLQTTSLDQRIGNTTLASAISPAENPCHSEPET